MGTAASPSMEEQSTHHPQLPGEILYEILLLLPVKSLHSLISSPQFQNNHFRRAQAKPPLLLTLRWGSDHYFTADFTTYNKIEETLTPVTKFRKQLAQLFSDDSMYAQPFMLSCRGLVCLASRVCTNPHILILNPSTQELINLPPTMESNSCVGFGYAASTEEFKVVMFFCKEGSSRCRCQVFTLGTSHWREVEAPPYNVDYSTAPFLHEALHFLPQVPSVDGIQDTDYIGAFDVDLEEYREGIPLPPYYYSLGHYEGRNMLSLYNFLRLSTLGGSLCLTFDFGKLKGYLELWLLKDYNNAKWVKGYVIDMYPVYPCPSFYIWAYPADNTIDESTFLNCSDKEGAKLVRYNPADGIVTMKNKDFASAFYFETFCTLSRQRYGGFSIYGSF